MASNREAILASEKKKFFHSGFFTADGAAQITLISLRKFFPARTGFAG
jgi:hypothetical protein